MENENEIREDELEEETVEDESEEDESSEDPYADLSQEEAIERLRKAEKAIEKNKKVSKQKKPTITKNIRTNTDDQLEERLELKFEMKQEGYPQEAIDWALKNGGRKALTDPITKRVLEEIRSQANAEQAADIDSSIQSTVFKKFSESDLENMSADEMKKALLNQK